MSNFADFFAAKKRHHTKVMSLLRRKFISIVIYGKTYDEYKESKSI